MKRIYTLVVLLSILSLTACDSEENSPTPITDNFSISLTGITNNAVASGVVTAEVVAKSETGIKKIEVFINDVLYATENGPVYKLSLDTYNYKDGPYAIKIIAHDQNGAIKQQVATIAISNPLFTLIDISPGWFNSTGTEYYYLITDKAGNILKKIQMLSQSGNIPISSELPTRVDTVNVYAISKSSSLTSIVGNINIKRGSTTRLFLPYTNLKPATTTNSTVKLKNFPSLTRFSYSSDLGSGTYDLKDSVAFTNGMTTDATGAKMLIQYNSNDKGYYGFYDFLGGQALEVNMRNISKPAVKKVFQYPGAVSMTATVFGYPYKDYANYYSFTTQYLRSDVLNYFIAEEPMDRYRTYVSITKANGWDYGVVSNGLFENIEPLEASANLINTNISNFKVAFSGQFDFYVVRATDVPNQIHTIFYAGKGVTNFAVPDFGTIFNIPKWNVQNIKLQAFEMHEGQNCDLSVLPYLTAPIHMKFLTYAKSVRKQFF